MRTVAGNLAILAAATTFALLLLDLALIVTGLFPPAYDYGDAKVGWRSASATGSVRDESCVEYASGERFQFRRNEDGVRSEYTVEELRSAGAAVRIAVGGDSHTDLCAPNPLTHFGVTESELAQAGVPSRVFANGAGKYSPLQAYLALEEYIPKYGAAVMVLNVYTGNDFYDMLRIDDRPHFTASDTGYAVAAPVWYQQDPPGVERRSRVLYAVRLLGDVTGVRRVWLRVSYLRDGAAAQGQGIGSVFRYMNDLRRAAAPELGYPQAYVAQMLNQQLFFHHFPGSEAESVARMHALLRYVRARHPDMLLVVSPIPSYQLVAQSRLDSSFQAAVNRTPLTFDAGIRQEEALYSSLRTAAADAGWLFVDNLEGLRAYEGTVPLYNNFDFHVEPVASRLIGERQAIAIAAGLLERKN